MPRGHGSIRGLLLFVLAVTTLTLASLAAIATWAIAPYALHSDAAFRAAGHIARAPFADRIVIGDSRIEMAEPDERALLVGFNGASLRDLERLIGLVCNISDAPVVIALGVNDSIPVLVDVDASVASVRRSINACGTSRVAVSGIWLPEAHVEPLGPIYDIEALAELQRLIAEVTAQSGAAYIPAPDGLSGHTFDGVHFTKEVSREYVSRLVDHAGYRRE